MGLQKNVKIGDRMNSEEEVDGKVENILPGLDHLRISIDSVNLDPGNARKHNPRNLDVIEHMLLTHGQYAPVVDFWKVGKINHDSVSESVVDWRRFLTDVTLELKACGAAYYIKKDLARFAVSSSRTRSTEFSVQSQLVGQ